MASVKKRTKKLTRRQRILEKKKMLGAFLIISFVAFGATVVTAFLIEAKADVFRTALASLFIGGIIAVFIEMRGKMSKKISRTRKKKR